MKALVALILDLADIFFFGISYLFLYHLVPVNDFVSLGSLGLILAAYIMGTILFICGYVLVIYIVYDKDEREERIREIFDYDEDEEY